MREVKHQNVSFWARHCVATFPRAWAHGGSAIVEDARHQLSSEFTLASRYLLHTGTAWEAATSGMEERIGLERSAQWVAYWVCPGDGDVLTYRVEDCTEGSGRFPGAREAAKRAAVRRGPSADYSPKVREFGVHTMGGSSPHHEGCYQGGARKSFPLQSCGRSVMNCASCLS